MGRDKPERVQEALPTAQEVTWLSGQVPGGRQYAAYWTGRGSSMPALAQLLDNLVGGEVAGEDAGWIAGDQPDDGEDQHGDDEQRRDAGDQAGEDEAPDHLPCPVLTPRSRRDAGGGATRADSSRGP